MTVTRKSSRVTASSGSKSSAPFFVFTSIAPSDAMTSAALCAQCPSMSESFILDAAFETVTVTVRGAE